MRKSVIKGESCFEKDKDKAGGVGHSVGQDHVSCKMVKRDAILKLKSVSNFSLSGYAKCQLRKMDVVI